MHPLINSSIASSYIFILQIGPGIVYLTFDSFFGRGAYLQALTPTEPLCQKLVHQVYFTKYTPPIVAKFYLLAEALMVRKLRALRVSDTNFLYISI